MEEGRKRMDGDGYGQCTMHRTITVNLLICTINVHENYGNKKSNEVGKMKYRDYKLEKKSNFHCVHLA
jgi:hypothetical protein